MIIQNVPPPLIRAVESVWTALAQPLWAARPAWTLIFRRLSPAEPELAEAEGHRQLQPTCKYALSSSRSKPNQPNKPVRSAPTPTHRLDSPTHPPERQHDNNTGESSACIAKGWECMHGPPLILPLPCCSFLFPARIPSMSYKSDIFPPRRPHPSSRCRR